MNSKKAPPEAGHITRRKKGADRKRLDPDLEAFARSDDKKFRPRREQRPRLTDPRPTFLISGVSNRDARLVLDARTDAIGALEPGEAYDRHMAEVTWLRLWRGRNFTAFDSYAEDVLGVNPAEAQAAAERGAKAAGRDLSSFDEETTAIWLRAEAAVIDAGGTVAIRVEEDKLALTFDVATAPQMIHAAGRRMTPLVHDREPEQDAPVPRRREAEATKKKRR